MQGAPGEVLAVEPDGILVALQRGGLFVKRVQPAGGGKMSAGAFAQERGLRAGQRLGDGAQAVSPATGAEP